MVRQARSGQTRRRILEAATDLFDEIGYAATSLGDIIKRAELTKGAFYYHFDSKESLAAAIIEEGGATVLNAFRTIDESSAPALERVIHGEFLAIDAVAADRVARVGTQLLRGLAGFNDAAQGVYHSWLSAVAQQVDEAIGEGDLREGLDADTIAETALAAMLTAELLSSISAADTDVRQRVARAWEILLPAIVSPGSLDYFREFLARESLRRPTRPAP